MHACEPTWQHKSSPRVCNSFWICLLVKAARKCWQHQAAQPRLTGAAPLFPARDPKETSTSRTGIIKGNSRVPKPEPPGAAVWLILMGEQSSAVSKPHFQTSGKMWQQKTTIESRSKGAFSSLWNQISSKCTPSFTQSSLSFFFNRIRKHVFDFSISPSSTQGIACRSYQQGPHSKAQKELSHSHGVPAHPSKSACFAGCFSSWLSQKI